MLRKKKNTWPIFWILFTDILRYICRYFCNFSCTLWLIHAEFLNCCGACEAWGKRGWGAEPSVWTEWPEDWGGGTDPIGCHQGKFWPVDSYMHLCTICFLNHPHLTTPHAWLPLTQPFIFNPSGHSDAKFDRESCTFAKRNGNWKSKEVNLEVYSYLPYCVKGSFM